MVRYEHSGGAPATTLVSTITAAALTLALTDPTGYPLGVTGPFVLTLDPGMSNEEKILCASRSGATVTVQTRAWDGTTASAHTAGHAVWHTFSAQEADDANAHIENVTNPHGIVLSTLATDIEAVADAAAAATAAVTGLLPAGMIVPYAAAAAPTGWLMCDGSSQLKATYPVLAALITTTYGAGDATHFVLPDLRGRVVAGLDNLGGSDAGRLAEANTLGLAIGAETVTLTSAQSGMPQHQHGVSDGARSSGIAQGAAGGAFAVVNVVGMNTDGSVAQNAASPHSVMQPTLTLNYIVKT
jgi:microcystin-dependent protein